MEASAVRLLSVLVPLGLGALAAPAAAQVTARMSVRSGGAQGDLESLEPFLSANGRLVAFTSEATNLVPGDTNGADDVFVRDRRSGTTVRVSVGTGGFEGDGDSYGSGLSADGRFVTFYSDSTNFVAGDTNARSDAFVHDLLSGTTTCVSRSSLGLLGDAQSQYPVPSGDGRLVAFYSWATNLVAGDTNGVSDVFVYDQLTGATHRVSAGPGGAQANGGSEYPVLSADGSRVAFESQATNLVPGDTNGRKDIFVRDFVAGTTRRVNVASDGTQANAPATYCAISGNGRFVGFESSASNLVAGDTNGLSDSFVHDLLTGVTTRISLSSAGAQGNAISLRAVPSFDGRLVAFKSQASNLVPEDTNHVQDIFVHDRRSGTTTRVSVGSQGEQAQGHNSTPAISADGRFVGFYSFAPNLVAGDTNGEPDAFVRSLEHVRPH